MRSVKLIVGTLLALGCAVAPARAAIITYNFTGTVAGVAGPPLLGGLGDAFSGSFSYDDTAATVGVGPFGGTAYNALSFIVDGTSLSNPLISIDDDAFGLFDIVRITSGSNPLDTLTLRHDGTDLFASEALSEMNGRTLSDFDVLLFKHEIPQGGGVNVTSQGVLTSLTSAAVAVPEPGTLALFGAALAGLGLMRRKRRTA